MAKWVPNNSVVTENGQLLLSKVQSGTEKLTITKVVTGSGRVLPEDLYKQTEVSDIKQNLSIGMIETTPEGSAISLQLTNTDLGAPYELNQIGVYAEHPDMGEILYMIAQCEEDEHNHPDTVPTSDVTPITMNYKFHLIHGKAELKISVNVMGYVSEAEYRRHLEEYQAHLKDFNDTVLDIGKAFEEIYNSGIELLSQHLIDYRELCDFVGYNEGEIYGVEIDYVNHKYTRIGASVGLEAGYDFDRIAPWGGRKRCNVTDSGVVVAYYGDSAYSEDGYLRKEVTIKGKKFAQGTHVQVMVEQPKFWYKVVPLKTTRLPDHEGFSLLKAKYYISPTPRVGFKVFPLFTRGNPLVETDVAYLPAYKGSIFDVTNASYESFKLTVKSSPIASGKFTLVTDKYGEAHEISVDKSETISSIINNIKSTSWSDWTVNTISGNSSALKFTAKRAGARNAPTLIDTDNTGIQIEFTVLTEGAGGYIENDAQVADFTESTGDLFCSIAGVKPASGYTQNLTRKNVSVLCNNRNIDPQTGSSRFIEGFGWQQRDLTASHCTAWLHLIEYGTLDCQTTIGKGVSSFPIEYDKSNVIIGSYTNMAYRNGDTSSLGNASGMTPNGIDGKCSVSYRGEENAWGNNFYWEEGLNIYTYINDKTNVGTTRAYFNVSGIYKDNTGDAEDGYLPIGFSLPPVSKNGVYTDDSGFIDKVGYDSNFDWGFIATKLGGYHSYPIHDYYHHGDDKEGWTVSTRNGFWHSNLIVGLNSRYTHFDSNYHSTSNGGGLLFIPEPKSESILPNKEES